MSVQAISKCELKNIEEYGKICGINWTQKILAGKWKISILWFLKTRAKRYTEIQKFLNNLSQGSLTKQLKELDTLLKELREYANEVKHIAEQKIPLDLDDGVNVNYEKLGAILKKR